MRPEDMMIAMMNMLQPNQTFRFHCDMCGDCCRHRKDILLTPFDLNRIARHLGDSPKEVIDRYCIVYVGDSSRFPVVLLKSEGQDDACPFLKDNRCSIHSHKPTVCALFPLGRAMMYDQETGAKGNLTKKPFYFLQNVACGTKDETHTVQEWLGNFGLEDSEAWFVEWSNALTRLSILIQELEKILPEDVMRMAFDTIFRAVYLNYYVGLDFMQQFRGNITELEKLLKELKRKVIEMIIGGKA